MEYMCLFGIAMAITLPMVFAFVAIMWAISKWG